MRVRLRGACARRAPEPPSSRLDIARRCARARRADKEKARTQEAIQAAGWQGRDKATGKQGRDKAAGKQGRDTKSNPGQGRKEARPGQGSRDPGKQGRVTRSIPCRGDALERAQAVRRSKAGGEGSGQVIGQSRCRYEGGRLGNDLLRGRSA